jgi:hypothetical protein
VLRTYCTVAFQHRPQARTIDEVERRILLHVQLDFGDDIGHFVASFTAYCRFGSSLVRVHSALDVLMRLIISFYYEAQSELLLVPTQGRVYIRSVDLSVPACS